MAEDRKQRKRQSSMPITETWAIVITVLLLLLFAARRLERASYSRNMERARRELLRLYDVEQEFYAKNGRYAEADEIEFVPKYPFTGILYSVKMNDSGFISYATEVIGHDAYGDDRAGNEYMAIDEAGRISYGTFVPNFND